MEDKETRILVIETSGQIGTVGLAEGRRLLAQASLDPARRHARDLAPAVQRLLGEVDWQARDVTAVFVSRGPGSYTGLRVGVMAAKAFAYAAGCALVAVDTFAAIASQSADGCTEVDVIADAQRELLYAQQFRRDSDSQRWHPATELRIVARSQWLAERNPAVRVSGPAVDLVIPMLPPVTPLAEPRDRAARLAGVLTAGWQRFSDGVRHDPMTVEPLYLRPSSAEENWQRNRAPTSTGDAGDQR